MAGNPIKPSHFVRRGRPLPKALSREQVQRLFGQIAHPMDRALFLVILRCGLRVSEVARLKLEQIDWEQQALHIVQGKGRKDRRVYMSPDAVASVQQCLAQHPGVQAQGYVFWNRKRAEQPLSRTPDTVWQLLGQLSDFIGIKNRHCELWCNMPP